MSPITARNSSRPKRPEKRAAENSPPRAAKAAAPNRLKAAHLGSVPCHECVYSYNPYIPYIYIIIYIYNYIYIYMNMYVYDLHTRVRYNSNMPWSSMVLVLYIFGWMIIHMIAKPMSCVIIKKYIMLY